MTNSSTRAGRKKCSRSMEAVTTGPLAWRAAAMAAATSIHCITMPPNRVPMPLVWPGSTAWAVSTRVAATVCLFPTCLFINRVRYHGFLRGSNQKGPATHHEESKAVSDSHSCSVSACRGQRQIVQARRDPRSGEKGQSWPGGGSGAGRGACAGLSESADGSADGSDLGSPLGSNARRSVHWEGPYEGSHDRVGEG